MDLEADQAANSSDCPMFIERHVWRRLVYYDRFRRLLAYLEENLADSPGLADLAKISCMSPNAFSRSFKVRVGITLWRFLSAYKLGRAHELMISSDLSITEIAHAVGFGSLSAFERTFHRVTGRSPSEYRSGLLQRQGVLILTMAGNLEHA
jgi:transcriptional regulator GlxA family with amidase domain